ncbi:Trafficking protein particle complex subunit 31 [Ascochyta rabiei]|uniref:Trafficking protein particle complex subunit 31 n=1 Tax=Didymella rabiei TaxID=5454 RepID=UPI00220C5545|nr:Trafficking protein particle complex subunit 31 [Ascochyta rabiei]UPX15054.1 Trafficking protein particle complex subunit 31 [Ascochyta rabiei]
MVFLPVKPCLLDIHTVAQDYLRALCRSRALILVKGLNVLEQQMCLICATGIWPQLLHIIGLTACVGSNSNSCSCHHCLHLHRARALALASVSLALSTFADDTNNTYEPPLAFINFFSATTYRVRIVPFKRISVTDVLQMSVDLDVLFACELDTAAELEPSLTPKFCPVASVSTADTTLYDDETGGASLINDELIGGPVADTGLPFGMHVDTYAEDTIKSLLRERDSWKAGAEKHSKAYEDLERRVYRNAIVGADLPTDIIGRLNLLESATDHYRVKNRTLRESLSVAENKIVALQNEIAGQKNRLKGAGKKVRNAKDAAGKQEEKAKAATHHQQLRTTSERRMKQERNEAVAEAQSLKKLCKDLQADLEVERSGRPHLRKGNTTSDTTTAVIPIELSIYRGDFLKLSNDLDANQFTITEQMQRWYEDCVNPQVVGANYASNQEEGVVAVKLNKLYADLVELVDGHQEAGAEHDGPRSKHTLEPICRKAEERHNSEN